MKTLMFGILFCGVVLSSTLSSAAPKKRTFSYAPTQVFEAALSAAREHHVVSFVDEKYLMFTFETGKSMSSYGNKCNVSIDAVNGGKSSEMVMNTQTKSEKQLVSWGAGGRLADDMFKWTEDKLKASPPVDTKTVEMESNQNVPTSASAPSGASQQAILDLASNPPGADVELDGSFVGTTPSSVGISPGEHTIRVVKSGYKLWERKMKTTNGIVKIAPELEKEDNQTPKN